MTTVISAWGFLGRKVCGIAHVQSTWHFQRVGELQIVHQQALQHPPENSVFCESAHCYTQTRKHQIFLRDWLSNMYAWSCRLLRNPRPRYASIPLTLLKEIWTHGNFYRGKACAPTSTIQCNNPSSEQKLCLHCPVSWIMLSPLPHTPKETHRCPQILHCLLKYQYTFTVNWQHLSLALYGTTKLPFS